MDLGELTLETFEPRVGDSFTITAGQQDVELVLEAADALDAWPGGRQPFSLTFRAAREPLLPQAIYRLEHAELGPLEIFIVALGQDARTTRYEAIFT